MTKVVCKITGSAFVSEIYFVDSSDHGSIDLSLYPFVVRLPIVLFDLLGSMLSARYMFNLVLG